MKTLFLFLFLICLSSFNSFSDDQRKFLVVERTEKNKAVEQEVMLDDLISSKCFDGKYFKIVEEKNDEAISFDAAKDLTFRAATAYYHLTKARNYFVNVIKSDFVKKFPKMIIRLNLKNQFSELGHFANDNLDPQYNNALTIPAGEGYSRRGIEPWGVEIWFRPAKTVHLNEIDVNDFKALEYKALAVKFRNLIHMQNLQRFLATSIMALAVDGGKTLFLDSVVRTAGSSLLLEAAYQLYDPITKVFQRKWYSLDSALIPEIIYHEYSHAALSDKLVLSYSSAVIEGMADFFASQIANSPELATHIKKYNTFGGKDAERKQDYMLEFESTDYANTDFVFGLLWEMKKIVGDDIGEAFMYELREKITTSSSIRVDLIEGILSTCETKCKKPFLDRLKILRELNSKKI